MDLSSGLLNLAGARTLGRSRASIVQFELGPYDLSFKRSAKRAYPRKHFIAKPNPVVWVTLRSINVPYPVINFPEMYDSP